MLTLVLGIFALLVSMFCICQLVNMLMQIKKNRSFVDNLQARKNNFGIETDLHEKIRNEELIKFQQKTYFDKLVDVFGDRNVLWWFIPVYRLETAKLTVEHELNQHYI